MSAVSQVKLLATVLVLMVYRNTVSGLNFSKLIRQAEIVKRGYTVLKLPLKLK